MINGLVSLGHLGVASVVFGPMLLAEKFTYILPDGYTGEVEIVFEAPGGIPEELGHGGVVFRIPEDGLLLVASKPRERSGWVRSLYFYQKQDRSLEPIANEWFTTIHDTVANRADRTVGIYLQGSGSIAFENCKFRREGFQVGTMAQHLDFRSTRDWGERLRERGLCKGH